MKKLLLTTLCFALSFAIFADKKGEEISRKNFDLKESKDSFSISSMILINSRGDKKIRKLKTFSKEGPEGRNSFIEFEEPADVKGTRFLTIAHKVGDDEQRLYLPALGKVRRISSSKKDGSFMGSDLNYYDMEDRNYEDNTYRFLREEKYNKMDCYVIERVPTDKNAPYSKQIVWINKADYFVYKAECYEKKGSKQLLKTIVFLDVKNFDGVLIPMKIVVDNHIKKHKTLLATSKQQINIGIKDSVFSVQNLQK